MATTLVRLGSLLVLSALAWPQAAPSGGTDGPFTLAVLRRDGVVIPFAEFDGRRWRNPWPVVGKNVEIPLRLPDIPPGWWPRNTPIEAWTAWPLQGVRAEVRSEAPVTVVAHCQLALGIRTSYKPAESPPPETEQPYPKDGLAASGDVVVERPVVIEASAAEWTAVQEEVQQKVTQLENRVLVHREKNWLRTISPGERAKTPFTPEVIMKVSPRAFYFEGIKTYPPQAPTSLGPGRLVRSSCNRLTYAAGWVLVPESGKPKVQASADLTDCDREGMLYSLPLGVIRRGDVLFWVVQVSGWGYERYEVLEVRGDRLKSGIVVPGGWCE